MVANPLATQAKLLPDRLNGGFPISYKGRL